MDSEFNLKMKGFLENRYPKFLLNSALFLAKKYIHEKEMGIFFNKNGHLKGIDFANSFLEFFEITYNKMGNIPHENRYIFTSNHPMGAIDGNILISSVGRENNNIKIVASKTLTFFENYNGIILPISSRNSKSKEISEKIVGSLQSDSQILIYPAGNISRDFDSFPKDSEWHPSIINWSKRYKRDIVPVYNDGENSKLFYFFSKVRRELGIKLRLEDFLIPRETFLQKGKTFNIVFGEPISYKTFTTELSPKEWAKKIYEKTYLLKEELYDNNKN